MLRLRRSCFGRYVHTKVVKRMDTVRLRQGRNIQQRNLLLPYSFGVSSTTLLDVLDSHLASQAEKSGRLSYSLHVLHVDVSTVEQTNGNTPSFDAIKERFPRHNYSVISLEDVMFEPGIQDTNTALDLDASDHTSNHDRLLHLISSATSATARSDLVQILRTKLIANFAKTHDCEAVLWGDSTTKLAEKTLAETAKGRGFALPWAVSDGESVHGIRFQYPMRDLLKKELITYADSSEPPLSTLVVEQSTKAPVSAKNSTIDELMTRYFESVEENFPSIVANVVRTTAKLENSEQGPNSACCRLCDLPFRGKGTPDGTGLEEQKDKVDLLCNSCMRSLHKVT